jgi:GTP-binding protein HflX
LARALDLDVVHAESFAMRRIHAGAYFGQGRIEAFKALVEEHKVEVVIVDTALSAVQQRNLERELGAKVVDRTGLILEIFGRRAQTKEGRLQVELARQAYERSRLVRTWTHLERQRGGLGKTGGPGETQIELDRRQIADRIVRLKRDLEEVRRTRALQRRARERAGYPAVVLVGYTNAGKSTLFNRLTNAGVFAKDMPFATLDPTARLIKLPSGRSVILSDTVGFISDLPTELVAAFRATLEFVLEADVLVHVRDIAHAETEAQRADVLSVIEQLTKSEKEAVAPPILEAWNKVDLLDPDTRAARFTRAEGLDELSLPPTAISAQTGDHIADLLNAIDRVAFPATRIVTLDLPASEGRLRARIASVGRILEEAADDDGVLHLKVELSAVDEARLGLSAYTAEHKAAAE